MPRLTISTRLFLPRTTTRGFQPFAFFSLTAGKAHDGQQIALLAKMRDRAVQDDFAGAAPALDGVGFKAFAIGHVAAEDFFIFLQAAFFHEVGGNRQAALVFNVATSNRRAVDFRFEQKTCMSFEYNTRRGYFNLRKFLMICRPFSVRMLSG